MFPIIPFPYYYYYYYKYRDSENKTSTCPYGSNFTCPFSQVSQSDVYDSGYDADDY